MYMEAAPEGFHSCQAMGQSRNMGGSESTETNTTTNETTNIENTVNENITNVENNMNLFDLFFLWH